LQRTPLSPRRRSFLSSAQARRPVQAGLRDSSSYTFNLLQLKRYFRGGPVHLIGWYDIVRGLRRFNPGLAVDRSFLATLRPFLDHGHPVVVLRNITEQVPFNVIYAADHNGWCVCSRGWRNHHHRCRKQAHQHSYHPRNCFHLNRLLSGRLSF